MDKNTKINSNNKTFLKELYPLAELKPKSIAEVLKLPRFKEKLAHCEQYFGASFDSLEYGLQQEIILLRLQQIVNIQLLNPLWKQRFKDFNIKSAPKNFKDWQKLPITDKATAVDFFSGDRKGMVVPLEHGGFEIVASGGTSTGKPSETVYSLKELEDTYTVSGKFISNHLFSRFFGKEDVAPLVVTTYADFQLWSSGTMVGGVLQKIPDTNYIAAGPIDKKIYHLMMGYEGPKVFLGITESIGSLYKFGLDMNQEDKDSLRLALYCSGLLSKRKQKELKELYPNLDILSYFSASQAEAIAIQLDKNDDTLTTVPALHFVEIVDEEGQWVKEGEEGELLVTRLHCNEAPIIRYKLGDKAIRLPIKKEEALKAFQFEFRGRSGDVIHLDDHQFSALNTYEFLKRELKNRFFINLEENTLEVQIVHRRAEKLLSVIIATDNVLGCEQILASRLGTAEVQHLIKEALITSMGLYSKSSIKASALEKIDYNFEIKFVDIASDLIHRTEVGKIPFFRDVIDTKS